MAVDFEITQLPSYSITQFASLKKGLSRQKRLTAAKKSGKGKSHATS